MDILYIILASVCAFIGILGSVVPVLPGPPLSYVALVLLYFCDATEISVVTLIVMGVLMAAITIIDYIAPAWMIKLKGGSKNASRGALVGTIIGLFFGPIGVILGPFLGAFVGELIAANSKKEVIEEEECDGGKLSNKKADASKAFNVALMSFWAFLLTSGAKLIYGAVVVWMLISSTIDIIIALFK